MPSRPSKRPKTVTKADAEAACLKQLRKMLKREPSDAELAAAVKVYRASWGAADTAIDKALSGRAKRG